MSSRKKSKASKNRGLVQPMDTEGETDEESNENVEELYRKPPKEKEEMEPMDLDDEGSFSETYIESTTEQGVRKSYLQKLFDQEVNAEGMEALKSNSDEAKTVDKAFRNLESRLGNAGKRCIEAYHKWGRNFWGQPEKDVLLGLLNGYWHQIMISVGVRLNADRKEASKTKNVKLLPPLTADMVNWKGSGSFPVPASIELSNFKSDRSGNPLNIETGHFKSINHRIRRDAKIECNQGDTIIGPCLVQPTQEFINWAKLVTKVINAWELRKHLRAPKQILQLFQTFLISPTLINWNNLIGASVLWKTHDKFLQSHGDWLNEDGSWNTKYAALGNFFNREIPNVYSRFINNDQLKSIYPAGYVGLMREMIVNEKNDYVWNGINAVEAQLEDNDRVLPASELDNASNFKTALEKVDLRNVPNVAEEVQPDNLVRKRQSQAARKAKKGGSETRVTDEQLNQLKILQQSGLLQQAENLKALRNGISEVAKEQLAGADIQGIADVIKDAVNSSSIQDIANIYALAYKVAENTENDPEINGLFVETLRTFLPTTKTSGASAMYYDQTEGCSIM